MNPSFGGRIGEFGSGGASLSILKSDSPASRRNAATYTRAFTFGCTPASLIIAPPYECPTNTAGPSCKDKTAFVILTSSAKLVLGLGTMVTLNPFSVKILWTPSQPEPSAQAP